jgi:GPI-anchor transamidase subunit T
LVSCVYGVCKTSEKNFLLGWSVRDLLEVELDTGCPLAQKSLVYVDQNAQGQMVFWPSATSFLVDTKNRLAVYDLRDDKTWEKGRGLGGKAVSQFDYGQKSKPIISAHRFVSGYGQQNGGIRCLIENSHPTASITVSYLEMLPWYLRVYFHTIRVDSQDRKQIPILKSHFVPGRDRQLPHQIELIFSLPAQTTVEFAVDFDFTLLKWTEYPPDAHRGFTIPPAIIGAKLDRAVGLNSDQCEDFIFSSNFSQLNLDVKKEEGLFCFLRLYTEPLLVNLPTPDFSMPYNVICMTCTVLALAFGPIHALTTKNFKLIDPMKNPSVLDNVKLKLKSFIARFRNRATVAPLQPDTVYQPEELNTSTSEADN